MSNASAEVALGLQRFVPAGMFEKSFRQRFAVET
jgi:hypothetical protein